MKGGENVDEEKVKEIETLFFEKRVIVISGEINQEAAYRLLGQLLTFNCQDDTAPITLYIRSGGGDTLAELDIFDALCCSPAPVNGVVAGMAYSAATTILQGCKYSGRGDTKGKRILFPHSRLLIHYGIHHEIRMDPEEMTRALEWAKTLDQKVREILIKASGQSAEKIEAQIKKGTEIWAEEALALGLADEIWPYGP